MGLEPTINRVIRCSPRCIVGSREVGEVVCSTEPVSVRSKGELIAATDNPKRNSLRPNTGAACMSESMLVY